jgi:hypothetical protein
MTFLGSDLAVGISWVMVCVGLMGAFICWAQYRYFSKIRYCVGPSGLISQYPASPPLIARWVDIFEIGIREINERTKRLDVELWDRSKYMVICLKEEPRKAIALHIHSHLTPEQYAKADQFIRQWALGIDD